MQVDDASVKLFHPLTLPELPALIEAMPPRYRLMILLAGWRGLRFGELTGLCRFDVGLAAGVPRVRGASRGPTGKGSRARKAVEQFCYFLLLIRFRSCAKLAGKK